MLCSLTSFAQRATSMRGQVTDQFGAVVVGATVTLTDPNGKRQTIQTDCNGAYRFDIVSAGRLQFEHAAERLCPSDGQRLECLTRR